MALRGRLLLLVALALAQAGADLELAVETPQQLLEALAEAAASPGASRLLLTGRVALPPSLANSTAAVVLEDGQELVLSGARGNFVAPAAGYCPPPRVRRTRVRPPLEPRTPLLSVLPAQAAARSWTWDKHRICCTCATAAA